jgi:ribosomal protein S12 methylthiotransferase accessory factor YcaO
LDNCYEAETFPILFDITQSDTKIPAFHCQLFDARDCGIGTFSGYGAHAYPRIAAKRAILEACQSRACYLAGARDDLFRRNFLAMKQTDPKRAIELLSEHPAPPYDWSEPLYQSLEAELNAVVKILTPICGHVLYKELSEPKDPPAGGAVVRVAAPPLEGYRFESWAPGPRARAKKAELAAVPKSKLL